MAATRRRPTKSAAKTTKSSAKRSSTRGGAAAPARRIVNLVPSRETEKDWGFHDAVGSGALTAVAALPASVDLRQPWWTIGDQEDTGSCVGWATAEGVLRYHFATLGKVPQNKPLSPRFIWMSSKETDQYTTRPQSFIEEAGTSLKAAVDVARKFGVVTDDLLPFHIATKMYTGSENTFYATAAQCRISAYFNMGKNTAQWKSWLASHGPILVGLSVDGTWDNATSTSGNLDVFDPNTVRGGHAVALVGYRADGRFIVRNSWGTAWGDQGFAYASPQYIAAGFFNESYGVTV
jgi:Papain family cysteine protease